MPLDSAPVVVEIEDAVATITLNRPAKRNAVTFAHRAPHRRQRHEAAHVLRRHRGLGTCPAHWSRGRGARRGEPRCAGAGLRGRAAAEVAPHTGGNEGNGARGRHRRPGEARHHHEVGVRHGPERGSARGGRCVPRQARRALALEAFLTRVPPAGATSPSQNRYRTNTLRPVSEPTFSHLDDQGKAHMVDVGDKSATKRRAVARATVRTTAEVTAAISDGSMKKGDVLAVARIAGIQAAKRTSDLIPLCHPLAITKVSVDLTVNGASIDIEATVETVGQTGVEMEALTAASVAALTIYDMCKSADKAMTIT
ncbi:MAG: cyclic pyranopterin monophosphate synthase MoaC, partial [Actinobacteria bacterium]|nr:cyclic pyranopterin monophosphate synthase MoaC [Actinomycetota bacterium]